MGFKLVTTVLLVAVALSGPLAPVAWSQEKMEAQMSAAKARGEFDFWWLGAAFATQVKIVGKGFLCGVGIGLGSGVLVASFGSGARWTGRVWEEGCGGSWIVTVNDLKGEPEPEFWIERPEYQR